MYYTKSWSKIFLHSVTSSTEQHHWKWCLRRHWCVWALSFFSQALLKSIFAHLTGIWYSTFKSFQQLEVSWIKHMSLSFLKLYDLVKVLRKLWSSWKEFPPEKWKINHIKIKKKKKRVLKRFCLCWERVSLAMAGAEAQLRRGGRGLRFISGRSTGQVTTENLSSPGHQEHALVSNWASSTAFCSVQSLSCVRLFATPWIAARQASLSITNSWSLPKPMSIKSVMPSNHLILSHSLLCLPSIFPSIRV